MPDLTPQSKKISIQIGGMTCQSCANRIEKVLNKNHCATSGSEFAAEEAQLYLTLRKQAKLKL